MLLRVGLSRQTALASPMLCGRSTGRLAGRCLVRPIKLTNHGSLTIHSSVLETRNASTSTQAAAPSPAPSPQPSSPLRFDRETKIQLSVLLGCGMLAQMAIGAIVPLLPTFSSSLGLSSWGVGMVIAVPSFARLLLNLPLGSLVDIVGRKPPLVFGTLVEAVGSLGTAMAGSLGSLLPPRLLVGAGSAAATTAAQAYTMDIVDRYPAHKGMLLGSLQAATLLAFAAGPAAGGLIAEQTGSVTLPFLAIAGVLGASVPFYALLPETRPPTKRQPIAAATTSNSRAAAVRSAVDSAVKSFHELLAQREQQALLALRFGLITGWSAWLTVLPLHAADVWGATAADLGTMCKCALRAAARCICTGMEMSACSPLHVPF